MKQPKRPTREQKDIIRKHMLIPDNWMVVKEDESYLTIQYKHGKERKILDKHVNKWKEREGR